MSDRIIVTVMGNDKIGIVAGVTGKLAEMNLNIIDINQSVFEENIFVMIMLVDKTSCALSMSEIKERFNMASEQLKVKIYAQHEDIFKFMHRI